MRRIKTYKIPEFILFISTSPLPLQLGEMEGKLWWERQRKILDRVWLKKEREWEKWREKKLKLIGDHYRRVFEAKVEGKDAGQLESLERELEYLTDLFTRFHESYHTLYKAWSESPNGLYYACERGEDAKRVMGLRVWLAGVAKLPF